MTNLPVRVWDPQTQRYVRWTKATKPEMFPVFHRRELAVFAGHVRRVIADISRGHITDKDYEAGRTLLEALETSLIDANMRREDR